MGTKAETKVTKITPAQTKSYNKLETKSARIRFLTNLGTMSRRQIADKVGVIYQFVYNVQNQKTK